MGQQITFGGCVCRHPDRTLLSHLTQRRLGHVVTVLNGAAAGPNRYQYHMLTQGMAGNR